MLFIFVLIYFVGFASSANLTIHNGWIPNHEFVFSIESRVLSGIHDIHESQLSGLKLQSTVRVQSFEDGTLRVKFERSQFMTFNGQLNIDQRDQVIIDPDPLNDTFDLVQIPLELLNPLETPFMVKFKDRRVDSISVHKIEPSSITNMKRAFVNQIQISIGNGEDTKAEGNLEEAPLTFYTSKEETLVGVCQTSYSIHQLPQYSVDDIIGEFSSPLQTDSSQEEESNSTNTDLCSGQKYFKVVKSYDIDTCEKRPNYKHTIGLESKCRSGKSSCLHQSEHIISSECIVCGSYTQFTILHCKTKDSVTKIPMVWATKERMKSSASMSTTLLSASTSFEPMLLPENRTSKSLLFELGESEFGDFSERSKSFPQNLGLNSPPFTPLVGNKTDLTTFITEQFINLMENFYETPENLPNATKQIEAVAFVLQSFDLDELNLFRNQTLKAISSESVSKRSNETMKISQEFLYNVLSTVGSNPSIMLIKEELVSKGLFGQVGIEAFQNILRHVRTPTQELIRELLHLFITLKNQELNYDQKTSQNAKDLINGGLIQMSELLFKACIHPVLRNVQYPSNVYTNMCSHNSTKLIQEWIHFLESEVNHIVSKNQDNDARLLPSIVALGKLGHKRAFHILARIIRDGGQKKIKPLIRSLAVHSLKRMVQLHPEMTKPILSSLVDNEREHTIVRIASIQVFPWSQPSEAELYKLALRTWSDTSSQVSSYIYSTLKSLSTTEDLELKMVGRKAAMVIHLAKPSSIGFQSSSSNIAFDKVFNHLKTSIVTLLSSDYKEGDLFPGILSFANSIQAPGYLAKGPSIDVFSEGLNLDFEKLVFKTNESFTSQIVMEQLKKIAYDLNLSHENDESAAKSFILSEFLGYTTSQVFNQAKLKQIIAKVFDGVHQISGIKTWNEKKFFQLFDVEEFEPTISGFLRFTSIYSSMLYSNIGSLRGIETRFKVYPMTILFKTIPFINAKIQSEIGVLSPFSAEAFGVGVEAGICLSTPILVTTDIHKNGKIFTNVKTPGSVKESFEVFNGYMKPFTFGRNLNSIGASQFPEVKPLTSHIKPNEMQIDFGELVSTSTMLMSESDLNLEELQNQIMEKFKVNHNFVSFITLGLFPSSVKSSWLSIIHNPKLSETTDLLLQFHFKKGGEGGGGNQNKNYTKISQHFEEVCRVQYPPGSYEKHLCKKELHFLVKTSKEGETICHDRIYVDGVDRMRCVKIVEACRRALQLCHSTKGLLSHECLEWKDHCQTGMNKFQFLKEELQIKGRNHHINRLMFKADLVSKNQVVGVKTTHIFKTLIQFGAFTRNESSVVNQYASAEFEFPQINCTFDITYHNQINHTMTSLTWDVEKILAEPKRLMMEGMFKFGNKLNWNEINFEGVAEKTQNQIKSVKDSKVLKRCIQQRLKNDLLSKDCKLAIIKANLMDKIVLEFKLPNVLHQHPVRHQIQEYIKNYFFGEITSAPIEIRNDTTNYKFLMILNDKRGTAKIEAEMPNQMWNISNLRIPHIITNLVQLKEPFKAWIKEKTFQMQVPTCDIAQGFVRTFDDRVYNYQLNNCDHLIFKDCSGRLAVAVLAKIEDPKKHLKTITILSGITKMVLKPKSSNTSEHHLMHIDFNVQNDGRNFDILKGTSHIERIDHENDFVEVSLSQDHVYTIYFSKEDLKVVTNGIEIEIFPPSAMLGQTCGLCGHWDGEKISDLQTPGRCELKKESSFGISYMLNKKSCLSPSAITEFQKEMGTCIKRETHYNEVKTSRHHHKEERHLVVKSDNQFCFSHHKVKICSSKNHLKQLSGHILRPVSVRFSCTDLEQPGILHLVSKALGGEDITEDLLDVHWSYCRVYHLPDHC